MCIAVIKRSVNEEYSYFIAFNRDELNDKKWETWGYHWEHYPNVFGFLDLETGGTWLARNDNGVVGFLINRECANKQLLNTRANIVLIALSNAKTAINAVNRINNSKIDDIRPFNFIAVDHTNIVYLSNCCDKAVKTKLNETLIMINRSFPNDFNEIRIKNNYLKFKSVEEPNPEKSNYLYWERILKKCSYTDNTNTEFTMSLVSDKWRTLSSSIIAIRRSGELPVIKDIRLEVLHN